MKTILLSAAALVASTALASAADLPMRAAPILPAPAFTWTGGYVGVNAGAAWNRDNRSGYAPGALTFPAGAGAAGSPFQGTAFTANPAFNGLTVPITPFLTTGLPLPVGTVLPLPGTCGNCGTRNQTTGLFGVQWGYNLQLSPGSGFVIGYESDLQYSGWGRNGDNRPFVTGTSVTSPAFVGTPPTGVFGTSPGQLGPSTFTFFDPRAVRASSMPEWFTTTRVRLGYAMDRVLVYATGGLAVGGGFDKSDVTTVATHVGNLTVANGSCWRSDKCTDARWGWVLGGGVEYAVTNSLSAKIEGLYADLGRRTETYNSPVPLQYGVWSGVGVAAGPATDRIVLTAPAGAFSPRAERLSSSFVVLRAGLNYRFTGL